jgi:hypothetical protein
VKESSVSLGACLDVFARYVVVVAESPSAKAGLTKITRDATEACSSYDDVLAGFIILCNTNVQYLCPDYAATILFSHLVLLRNDSKYRSLWNMEIVFTGQSCGYVCDSLLPDRNA